MSNDDQEQKIFYSEIWLRENGHVFRVINGKVVNVWSEKEAPVAFMGTDRPKPWDN